MLMFNVLKVISDCSVQLGVSARPLHEGAMHIYTARPGDTCDPSALLRLVNASISQQLCSLQLHWTRYLIRTELEAFAQTLEQVRVRATCMPGWTAKQTSTAFSKDIHRQGVL